MKILIILLLAAISGTGWAGDIYRWVDEKGVIRYSDQMPPTNVKNVQKFRSTGSSLVSEKTPAPTALPQEPIKTEEVQKLPLVLYSFDDCGDVCKKAEAFLDQRGIPYALKNTNNDKIALQKLTGKLDVPVLVIGNTPPITGLEEGRWNKELDLAGYAKSNPNVKPGTSMAIKPATKEAEAAPPAKE